MKQIETNFLTPLVTVKTYVRYALQDTVMLNESCFFDKTEKSKISLGFSVIYVRTDILLVRSQENSFVQQ